MSYVSASKTRLLVGDFRLSTYATQVAAPWSQEMLDTTTIEDTAKAFIIGQEGSTLSVSGLYDTAEHADLGAWKSAAAQPITWGPSGFSVGSELWMVNGLLTELTAEAATGAVAGFSLNAQTDGITDMGVSLHDLAAVTADTNGTSVDGAAATTGGAAAHLHVTAFSGFSGVVVTVEDSANDSTWATIGTFTTVAGATAERITIAGTVRRYVRCVIDVTGTGSITLQVGLARR